MDQTLVQHGILDAMPAQGSYLFFSARVDGNLRKALKKLAHHADGEAIVVGIGASLAKALNADIHSLRNFPALDGAVDVPSTPFALWC
jgi:putative iron-dependent peroxidase